MRHSIYLQLATLLLKADLKREENRPHFDKLDEETDRLLNGTEEEESEFAAAMRKRDEAKAAGNGLGFVDIDESIRPAG